MDNKINVQTIKKILAESIYAPSGDNSQPWAFKIKDDSLYMYLIPENDTSVYNYKQQASLVAVGGVLENIKLIALYYGYECSFEFYKDLPENLVSRIFFKKSIKQVDVDIYNAIHERKTNRKPYSTDMISASVIDELKRQTSGLTLVDVSIVQDVSGIQQIASACSQNEKVVLEDKRLHDFLFQHITWDEKEDQIKKGFFIKTLELQGPQKFVFKMLKSWKVNSFLNKLGIANLVAADNKRLYAKSSLMIGITSKSIDAFAFFETGMLMQRVWLVLTKYHISAQPLTGIILLKHRLLKENTEAGFTQQHVDIINQSYQLIIKSLGFKDGFATLLLRAGFAADPTACTKRRDVSVVVE